MEWKSNYGGKYACLLEGARRVGKTTIAEYFAQKEYKSYIKIDFSEATEAMLDIMKDIVNLDIFFLKLQAETDVTLYDRESVIIFDEIQLYPKVRQAIKHLVKDGRYDYIETGSLISIRKNVKDILIPSEEHKINVYPMDYEEFLWATQGNFDNLRQLYKINSPIGDAVNRTLMRNFRIYMAVGGMPQAVEAYVQKKNFNEIDKIKREIIRLYVDDLKKIDSSGRLSDIFNSVPSQLALKRKRFVVSMATGKQKTARDEERLFELVDSKIVTPCYHVSQPSVSLSQTRDVDRYKLYLSDTGLFVTMLFNDSHAPQSEIYKKLISDKLDADLGYLYENAVAQIIVSSGRKLYYHTWQKKESSHYYEVDFLLTSNHKVVPIEVKSASIRNHDSITQFAIKYSQYVGEQYLISQKDVSNEGSLKNKPIYLLPLLVGDL
ncbi:MAG: ATP-binding protein [Paludibacteraceae bacterium]|nr:ATP-binding protein [Paludibacteraceae bacterium]